MANGQLQPAWRKLNLAENSSLLMTGKSWTKQATHCMESLRSCFATMLLSTHKPFPIHPVTKPVQLPLLGSHYQPLYMPPCLPQLVLHCRVSTDHVARLSTVSRPGPELHVDKTREASRGNHKDEDEAARCDFPRNTLAACCSAAAHHPPPA